MSGIRPRVLAIALIPSAALFITGAAVAGSLISNGLSARNFANLETQSNGTLIGFQTAVQHERTISLRALAGDPQALAGLQAQWNATDTAMAATNKAVAAVAAMNPQNISAAQAADAKLMGSLPAVRQEVRTRQVSAAAVDALYTGFNDLATGPLLMNALGAPNPGVAVNMTTTLDLARPVDQQSRTAGLGAGWAERGMLSQPERLQIAQLAGAYRNGLQALAFRLTPAEQATYRQLTTGSAWRLATSGEDNLAQRGQLGVPYTSWLAAENTVSTDLLGVFSDSLLQGQKAAAAAANQTLSRAVLLGSLVLVLSAAAFAVSLVLANRLVGRLRRLRTKTLELADVKLPSIVARLGEGERVDVDSEIGLLDYGSDEIGQVAEAFNSAQRTAVTAAVAEASTRSGINKVFLDIAHRSQLVVHRQLELLDVAEARQGDPEHLEMLFQLDHLATRARRNAENLVILGGGQPGRKWRRPAALEDVVRSAVSETEHFARVDTVRLPAVQVQGSIVGDLVHLLAELVDNATAFSPPEAPVTVRGGVVGKGVVVEVEDQGLGIVSAERERLNETLRNPPGFQEMALSGQRQLGLFVVGQLAQRHGISVQLLESAYGGIKAIVLIPADAVDPAAGGDDGLPAPARAGRHEQLTAVPAWAGSQPVTRSSGSDGADSLGRAIGAPAAEPVQGGRRPAATPAPAREPAAGPVPRPAGQRRAPLPRRERMANLAPGLRPDADGAADEAGPRRPFRSAEEARGSMSAFQRGTRLGRNGAGEDK